MLTCMLNYINCSLCNHIISLSLLQSDEEEVDQEEEADVNGKYGVQFAMSPEPGVEEEEQGAEEEAEPTAVEGNILVFTCTCTLVVAVHMYTYTLHCTRACTCICSVLPSILEGLKVKGHRRAISFDL